MILSSMEITDDGFSIARYLERSFSLIACRLSLGPVDVYRFQANESERQVQSGLKACRELIVSCGDGTELFHTAKQAFDTIAFVIGAFIGQRVGIGSCRAGFQLGHDPFSQGVSSQRIAVEPFVGHTFVDHADLSGRRVVGVRQYWAIADCAVMLAAASCLMNLATTLHLHNTRQK